MDFSIKGKIYGEQTLRLAPQTLESLGLLQLGSLELYDYIEKLALENPVIDMDVLEAGEKNRRAKSAAVGDAPPDISEYVEDRLSDLASQLRLQLTADLPRDVYLTACYLIDNLDDSGYLAEPLEDTVRRLGIEMDLAVAALTAVQRLEPRGIGAKNLRECLLLQLEAKGLRGTAAWDLADLYLEDLAKNHLPAIAKKLGITPAEVTVAAEILRRECEPRPLASEQRSEEGYILPDIDIRRGEGGGFVISIMQLESADLTAGDCYVELVRKRSELDEQTREFLTENFSQMKWLRRSLRQRGQTLRQCAEGLVKLQSAFFTYGPRALKPLLQQELARALEINESTVSRAFSGKYISCEWGVFPSGYFFPQPVTGSEGNIIKSEVCGAISEIIAAENPQNPLSDSAIVAKLQEQGIKVSRRTVALYRDEIGIPASSMRRVHM